MSPGGTSRVLIIDDDESITGFIAASLTIDGYQPVIASSVEDALQDFENMNYSLVITDIFMAGMGGIEGISEIRKRAPNIKIIAISGGFMDMSMEDALKAAKKIGADAILPKPLTTEDISQEVGKILG